MAAKKPARRVASAAATTAAPTPTTTTTTPLAATFPSAADIAFINQPNPPAHVKTTVAGNLPDAFTPPVLSALGNAGLAAFLGSDGNATTIQTALTQMLEAEGVRERFLNGAAVAALFMSAPSLVLQAVGRLLSDKRKEIAAKFPALASDLAPFYAVWDPLHHVGPRAKKTPATPAPSTPKTPATGGTPGAIPIT